MTAAIIVVLHLKVWALGTLVGTAASLHFGQCDMVWQHSSLGVAQIASDIPI